MEELNVILFLVNFVKTLFVIIVIYYLIRFVARLVLPLFFNRPKQSNNFNNQQKSRKEGDVTIEGNKSQGGKFSNDEGEYVDFEEVD
ncbi:hypothetical protein [Sunxiuqinia indica]|uniref:hypothetical protein n=1 Tax=Sunxiuqinia indica TaxID=2692584 RepID=UPI001357A5D7|nr:hypothetical protein [Sunxiuqinia indica]